MWKSEWNAVSARISALLDAGTFLFKTGENDNFNISDVITGNAGGIVLELRHYLTAYETQLPNTAKLSLARFFQEFDARFPASGTPGGFPAVAGILAMLAAFRSEFEHLLSSKDAVARSLVVRAFLHLQRSIVADETIRVRWQKAFSDGEVHCEQLGACHLLAHGIWAFKTDAAGERTDLVLNEPLKIDTDVQRAAEALVLTEWKVVTSAGEASAKAESAYAQAKRYSVGILGGFELASTRYLVLVSPGHLDPLEARQEAGTRYEFINIAVSPISPSKEKCTVKKNP